MFLYAYNEPVSICCETNRNQRGEKMLYLFTTKQRHVKNPFGGL